MGKDEMKSSDYCPDCAEREAASDADAANTDCSCCCCSCCESASESESNNVSVATDGNQAMASLEQRKKEMLSNLTILKTNREQVSVQHLLQFIEALNHSPDFIRRYNLQEDFCLQCLLSEPTCTCCITGVSQMNLNDESSNSCDECNRDENRHRDRYSASGCADCFSAQKASSPERPRIENSRERRRRRRRQRHIQHNLPRVSVANISPHGGTSYTHQSQQNTSNRYPVASNNVSVPRVNQDETSHDINCCDECCREEVFKKRSNPELRRCSDFARDQDSDFCEECSRTNSLSTSCTVPGCNECESESHRDKMHGNSSLEKVNKSCTCCIVSPEESTLDKNYNGKAHDKPNKPECDKNDACNECSDCDQHQSTAANCNCEECQENSDCSDDSCSECKNHNSREKKNKK